MNVKMIQDFCMLWVAVSFSSSSGGGGGGGGSSSSRRRQCPASRRHAQDEVGPLVPASAVGETNTFPVLNAAAQ
jgi:hypothetical protein